MGRQIRAPPPRVTPSAHALTSHPLQPLSHFGRGRGPRGAAAWEGEGTLLPVWRSGFHSANFAPMTRTIILYAVALALAAAALEWLKSRYALRHVSPETYIALLALGFAALGIWAGRHLTPRPAPAGIFAPNEAAIRSLGLTPRECEILGRLATGESIKEMARALGISPNTVKTHDAKIYEKQEAPKRNQAVEKARFLGLIP